MSGLFLYYSSRRQVPAPLQAFITFMRRHREELQAGQITVPRPAPRPKMSTGSASATASGAPPGR
jgi:hypothetical protein